MKKLYISIILLSCLYICSYGQSPGENYVKELILLEQYSYDGDIDIDIEENIKAVKNIQYYDGLGRPTLNVRGGVSPSGKYSYTLQTYDYAGLSKEQWLPVAGGVTPDFMSNDTYATYSGFTYNDSFGYSENKYDALGRLVSSSTPGEAWHSAEKMTRKRYITNTAGSVKRYKAPLDKISLIQDGHYAAGTLTGEETEDEDGHTVIEYKDMSGHTVLERRDGCNDTYFVYNDLGHLRYVLSPEYQNSGYKALYAYEYRYDARGRCVKKILPGCKYTQFWYDDADRQVFMQDATLRERGLYRFFLYDRFGRLAIQGTCDGCTRNGKTNISRYMSTGNGMLGTGYQTDIQGQIINPKIEIVNYYDDYDFLRLYSDVFPLFMDKMNAGGHEYSITMNTGTMMVASNGEKMLKGVYYDKRGRVTDIKSISLGKRLTSVHNEYTFTDNIKRTEQEYYSVDGDAIKLDLRSIITNNYEENTGVLLSADMTVYIPGKEEKTHHISTLTYDDLGRITGCRRSGNAGRVSYGYDMHGWTKSIEGPGFEERLHYEDGYGTPCYNGNISSMSWQAPDYTQKRGYKFTYDGLDRLTEAVYGERDDMSNLKNRYNEKVVQYTCNGAIKRFQRRGLKDDGIHGKIDNLHIALSGNRIIRVDDDAEEVNKYASFDFKDNASNNIEYTYNSVGALVSDANKGIKNIEYDNLNNPKRIIFSNGSEISYVYSPDGRRLKRTHVMDLRSAMVGRDTLELVKDTIMEPHEGSIVSRKSIMAPDNIAIKYIISDVTEYNDNLVYDNGLVLFMFPGGYLSFYPKNNQTPNLYYYTKDHLGNNRAVVCENGDIKQITHYYPFGGVFGDAAINASFQQYKYNGKELDTMHGLNMYDYGARMYNPILLVWDRMDPFCEKYYHISPYAYCGNNPVNRIDPDGKDYWSTSDADRMIDFINALGRGQTQFDFSDWQHATDAEFTGHLTYNDETKKFYTYYTDIVNGEVTVVSKSFDANLKPVSSSGYGYPGAFVYEPLDGFLLNLNHILSGTTYYDGFAHWNVNSDGRITGFAPITGIAPTFGKNNKFVGGKQKMGHAIGKMSGNRMVQKEQTKSLANKYNLNKKERRLLHDEINHQGLGYHEIEEFIHDFFGK